MSQPDTDLLGFVRCGLVLVVNGALVAARVLEPVRLATTGPYIFKACQARTGFLLIDLPPIAAPLRIPLPSHLGD